MKKEKIILSFIATLIGLLFAGVAFYIYESSKAIPQEKIKTVKVTPPSPTPKKVIFLNLDKPKDEEVVSKKIITVSGKTTPDATIVILSKNFQEVVTPAENGDFSLTMTIEDGLNIVQVTAIAPNGEEAKLTRAITFSTEEF